MNVQQYIKRVMISLICIMMLVIVILPVISASDDHGIVINQQASASARKDNILEQVWLTDKSYIEVAELHELPGPDGKMISFDLRLYNGDQYDMRLINYWVRIKANNGSNYSVNLLSRDQQKDKVTPLTSQTLTFYTSISSTLNLTDLTIEIIEWDFSVPDYERVIGTISVPSDYDPVVPSGMKKIVPIDSTSISLETTTFQMQRSTKSQKSEVNLDVQNVGLRSVVLPEYNFFMRSDEGIMFELEIEEKDSEAALQPRVLRSIVLTGDLPLEIHSEKWQLWMTQEISEANWTFDLPIAAFELSEQTKIEEPSVEIGKEREITIENESIFTWIEEMRVVKKDKTNAVRIGFSMENRGSRFVNLPEYIFLLRTAEGYEYPFDLEQNDIQRLSPLVKETFQLQVEIPQVVKLDNMELLLYEKDERTNMEYFIGSYLLEETEARLEDNGLPIGMQYTFENKEGRYSLTLKEIQRLPWEEDDIIAAHLVLRNEDAKILPLLELNGVFELDGIKLSKEHTQTEVLDRTIGLGTFQESSYVVYTTIPYTYEYERLKLIVNELESESEQEHGEKIVDYETSSVNMALPVVERDGTYSINYIGNQANITLRDLHTFRYEGSIILYVEVEIENKSKRPAEIPELVGYFKNDLDIYYSTQMQELEHRRIAPSSKALLALWTRLPSGQNPREFDLVLGQKVGQDSIKAMINASQFQLPYEKGMDAKRNLEDLSIYPYNISLEQLNIQLSSSATLNFKYELEKDRQYELTPDGHRLVIEMVNDGKKYRQTYELEQDLQLGRHEGSMVADLGIQDPFDIIGSTDGFEINLYHEFEGHQKLLGTQKVYNITTNSGF